MILYGSGEDEITFTYDDGVRHYSTTKPFEGVINNIERRWRETELAWVTEELSRYQSDQFCEACRGYRLKPQALAVKIAGLHIGQVTEMSIKDARTLVRGAAREPHAEAERDRRAHPEGDQGAAHLPQRCRARLSDARPRGGHAVGRREPAHPPRLADRLRPHRRALCAGRAFDRTASARQCAAARDAEVAAQHGQLRARGGARRGGDPHRRLCRRYGPRRRHPWRRGGGARHARAGDGEPGEPHRAISHRLQADPLAQGAAQADARAAG